MTAENVIFPEPGRMLLQRTWSTLNEWLRGPTGEPGFVIGGGTMLAARWGHRKSKDLDIRVVDSSASGLIVQMDFDPKLEERFDQAMHRSGAQHRQRINKRQIVYVFGDSQDPEAPKVDLLEGPSKLNVPEIWTASEGMSFWSASNAEILAGKWKDRRGDLVLRDIYDFAVAGLVDGHALQQALTTEGDHQQIDEMIAALAAGRETLSNEAESGVLGVPEALVDIQQDPAKWAARAIGRWALSAVEIKREEGKWKICTWCKGTPEGCERARCDTLEEAGKRTAELTGLPAESVAEMTREAHQEGGVERQGPKARMTSSTEPEMTVDARGTVLMRDFGVAETRTPTIEAAVELAIERGWEQHANRQQATEELRALQVEAIEIENERTPTE